MYYPSVAEYENEDIHKMYLTAEEPLWDQSTSEYSEGETQLLDHQCQISIPAIVARGLVYVSAIISYSLAYDVTFVMNNDNLVLLSTHNTWP